MAIQKNTPIVVYIAQKVRLFVTNSRKKDNKKRTKAKLPPVYNQIVSVPSSEIRRMRMSSSTPVSALI